MATPVPRWAWALLARAVLAAHVAFCIAVLASPWLPWWIHSNLVIAPLWGLAANRWHCRLTQWEYRCRQMAGEFAFAQGLVRRLLNAPGRCLPRRWRWDVGETVGSVVMIGALVLSVAVRAWLKMGPAFWL